MEALTRAIDTGLSVDGVSVRTAKGVPLLRDVRFDLPAGGLLAVVGPSGAGKTTLLRALLGTRPADQGTVRCRGRDLYADYDRLRRPRTQRIARQASVLGRVLQASGPITSRLRDTVLRLTPPRVAARGALAVQRWQPPAVPGKVAA